jgi:hypothetical protein
MAETITETTVETKTQLAHRLIQENLAFQLMTGWQIQMSRSLKKSLCSYNGLQAKIIKLSPTFAETLSEQEIRKRVRYFVMKTQATYMIKVQGNELTMNNMFICGCIIGDTYMVKSALWNAMEFGEEIDFAHGFQEACMEGHIGIVKLIDKHVNYTNHHIINGALFEAWNRGQDEFLHKLYTDVHSMRIPPDMLTQVPFFNFQYAQHVQKYLNDAKRDMASVVPNDLVENIIMYVVELIFYDTKYWNFVWRI